MAIKVPDNFRPSDYGIELSIPNPVIESSKNKDGSFDMYVRYSSDSISDLVREAAREINDKMEAKLIDELLRMNGYVPKRTGKVTQSKNLQGIVVCECGEPFPEYYDYCPYCGAKVVE